MGQGQGPGRTWGLSGGHQGEQGAVRQGLGEVEGGSGCSAAVGGRRGSQAAGTPEFAAGVRRGGARPGRAERGTFLAGRGRPARGPCPCQSRAPAEAAERGERRAGTGGPGDSRGGPCRLPCRRRRVAKLRSEPAWAAALGAKPAIACLSQGGKGSRGGSGGGHKHTHATRHPWDGPRGPRRAPLSRPPRGSAWPRGGTGRDTGSPGAHVRQVGACGRARGSAEAPVSPLRRGPPSRPGRCWGVRSGVRGACGSASGPSWCWWRSTRWRVAAPVPAWLRGAGPSPPGPTAASPGSTRTWRSALWPSWPPPGPQCPPTPLVACRTSPPGPGYPPPPAPRDSLRGRGAVDPGGGTPCPRLSSRCRGTSWAPPPTRCTCSGCRQPTPAAGHPPLTSHPPPMTVPTAPCSSAPRGDPAAPRRLLGPGGLCRGAGATHCPGRPPRPSTGGPAGCSCPQEGPARPGTARRCHGQQPAGSGCRGAGGDSGGRGDTSSLTPPVWWSGPSTCHPRSDSRSAMPGAPWDLAPLLAALPCPPWLAALLPSPRRPGSPPAAPAARGRARGAAGLPAGGPRRGGRRCTPRRCGKPCPASAGTRRPTRTRMPRAAWGAPGSGSAETPAPTAAAAAAWRAPEPARAPPAPPRPERWGLAGCGPRGGAWRGVVIGGGAQDRGSHGLTPIKAPPSRCAASAPVWGVGGWASPPQASL